MDRYKKLALAVIMQAMEDTKMKTGKNNRQRDIDNAKTFLDNSPALGLYADVAGVGTVLEKAGYLHE